MCSRLVHTGLGASAQALQRREPLGELFTDNLQQGVFERWPVVLLDRALGDGDDRADVETGGFQPRVRCSLSSPVDPDDGLEEISIGHLTRDVARLARGDDLVEGIDDLSLA